MVGVDFVDWEKGKIYYGPPRDRGIYSASFSDLIMLKNAGLKDKNGKNVFQGDIILNNSDLYSDLPKKMIVQFSKHSIFLTIGALEKIVENELGCVTNNREAVKAIIMASEVRGNVFFK